jgi:hypothetical protein
MHAKTRRFLPAILALLPLGGCEDSKEAARQACMRKVVVEENAAVAQWATRVEACMEVAGYRRCNTDSFMCSAPHLAIHSAECWE